MRPPRRIYSDNDFVAFLQWAFNKLGVGPVCDTGLPLDRGRLPLRVGQPDRRLGLTFCTRTAAAWGGTAFGAALGPSRSRSGLGFRLRHASRKTRLEPQGLVGDLEAIFPAVNDDGHVGRHPRPEP